MLDALRHSSSHDDDSHYDSYDSSHSSSSSDSDASYSKSYVRDGPNHCRRQNCGRDHAGIVRCDRVCDGGIRLKCKRVCKGSTKHRRCKETCKNHGDKYFEHRFKRNHSKIRHWTKYYNLHGDKFECQARCRLRSPLVFCRKRCFKNAGLVSDRFVSYDIYHNSIHQSDTTDFSHPHIANDMPAHFVAPADTNVIVSAAAPGVHPH